MEEKFLSPAYIKKLLSREGLRPNKNLGQHFLVDKNILEKILEAARLESDDYLLEIGAGLGTLSIPLAARSNGLLAVEVDRGIFPLLEEQLVPYPEARAVLADVRRLDLKELCLQQWGNSPVKVVANLPYYLTTPFLFQLLQDGPPLSLIVLMIQKEAALRLVASPGTRDYGVSTLLCQFYARPQFLFEVPPSVFYPRPKVSSAVVSLKPREEPFLTGPQEEVFWQVVKAAFATRRKTLLNNLCQSFNLPRADLAAGLENIGLSTLCRGESLTLEEFANVTDFLYNIRGKNVE